MSKIHLFSLFLTFSLLAVFSSCSSDGFKIDGNLSNLDGGEVRIVFSGDSGIVDEWVGIDKKGKFSFKGMVTQPIIVSILDHHNKVLATVAVKAGDHIKIKGDASKAMGVKVKGNRLNEEWQLFRDEHAAFYTDTNPSRLNAAIEKYVREHPADMLSTVLLVADYTDFSDRDKVEVLLRQIDCAITITEKPQDDPEEPTGEKTYFTTSKGYQGYVLNGVTYIEGLLVVNKTYSLPSSYGKALTSQTQAAYNRMKQAAAKEGIKLSIVSGFRSYSYQVDLYNRYVKSEGKAQADSHSARPGHSEHQAGLAMDINSLSQSFDQTPEFAWLQANAWKYGFIMRYPKDSTAVTGYIYEPWHYRYVGEQWAEVFYNNGNWLTVEEYFGITSRYSD